MTTTDENIMQLVVDGDLKKSSVLFDRYHVNVYSYLMKVNRDKMLAEDLTQNVFEKLIKYRESYDGKKSFKAWLFTIVRNANIDHHRKRKYQSLDDSHLQVPSMETDQHRMMEDQESRNKLMAAIDLLPSDEKEVIILSKIEKLKYAEISKITGISESALKVKAHRTIKKLRTILVNDMKYEY